MPVKKRFCVEISEYIGREASLTRKIITGDDFLLDRHAEGSPVLIIRDENRAVAAFHSWESVVEVLVG